VKFIESVRRAESTGFRVAVVGAGPAGLAAAAELACRGHEVHVYDRLPEPGGMLMFVIPDFRFPKESVREGIRELERLGVVFRVGVEVDSKLSISSLIDDYDAVLVATGTWRSRRLNVKGEDLDGVHYALEWMHRYVLHKLGYSSPPEPLSGSLVVVGAGLSAVDVCEVAIREFGARPVVVYRRPLRVAPAAPLLSKLVEKGLVKVVENVVPVEILGNQMVEGIKVVRVSPTERRVEEVKPIPGTEQVIEAERIIVAAGLLPTPPHSLLRLGVRVGTDGSIMVDENYMTSLRKVFAAGDVAQGPTSVWRAMASGRRAADRIDKYLRASEHLVG